MEEIWKDVKGYEGLYRISNFGNVLGVKRGKLLKHSVSKVINNKITYVVNLTRNGVSKTHSIHLLVYNNFIGKPIGMIDFKDGDSSNLSLYNLIYVDKTFQFKKSQCKRVLNTENMMVFDSISDFSIYINKSRRSVNYHLVNKTKKYSHYKLID